ncbi:MAG TPA: hypothetical protein VGB73_01305 [Pyrinomonadaceae bacterium]
MSRSIGERVAGRVMALAVAGGVMFGTTVAARASGSERAKETTGEARETKAFEAGEVLVVLNERLLNALLEAMLALPEPPSFPLSRRREEQAAGKCASEVVLRRESSGVQTAVRFTQRGISAPVAFRGSYDAPLVGCLKFEGWADTTFALSFDRARQVLEGRINVREVHLKNVPSLVGGGVTQMVQEAIDRRVNPIELLRAEQLGTRIDLKQPGGGVLRLRAREVRHEVVQKELRLRIFYEVLSGD